MRKAEIEHFINQSPLKTVEVQLVDGRKFRLRAKEPFIIGYSSMVVYDRGKFILLKLGLVSSITPANGKK